MGTLPDRVLLNENFYRLYCPDGKTPSPVTRQLMSQFPPKQIDGDSSYDNELYISKWTLDDFRGGIGIEEYDATKPNRCYWHSGNADHKGHFTLPSLATQATLPTLPTIANGGMETWTTDTDIASWTEALGGGTGAVTKGTGGDAYAGTFSAKVFAQAGTGPTSIDQDLANWSNNFRSKPIVITAVCKVTLGAGASASMIVDDGVGTTTTNLTAGTFTAVSVVRILNVAATKINIKFTATNGVGGDSSLWVDSVAIAALDTTMVKPVEFDGDIYFPFGAALVRFSSAGAFTLEGIFPNTITSVISSVGPCLYVFLGDTDQYWWMTAADVWTVTTTATATGGLSATWGKNHSNKLWKVDSAGAIYHCADPARVDPTFTANGALSDNGVADNYINSIEVGPDSTGVTILYVGTRIGLFAHDTTNARFLLTTCAPPDNANNGKGLVYWKGLMWFSAGQRVIAYLPSNGDISEEGLDQDDGLPAWADPTSYITGFVTSQFCLYALVHQGATGGTLGVYKKNLQGAWHTYHTSSTVDFHAGIVSSVYANRLWFDKDSGLYYIVEQLSNIRPGKIADFSFHPAGTSQGILNTPWFSAGSASNAKLALSISFLATNLDSDETIIVYYQIDHIVNPTIGSPEALASYWGTALGTAIADGVTTYTFGTNGVGLVFKSIRFKFILARGSTATESPDLQSITFNYIKSQNTKWGWSFTVDCREEFGGQSPMAQETAIEAATEATTLVTFAFRDSQKETQTPHYVKIIPPQIATMKAGDLPAGVYRISVFEP